jgi:hypothetical protein
MIDLCSCSVAPQMIALECESMLLVGLPAPGLLENTGGAANGGSAWQFVPGGEEIVHASQMKEQTR